MATADMFHQTASAAHKDPDLSRKNSIVWNESFSLSNYGESDICADATELLSMRTQILISAGAVQHSLFVRHSALASACPVDST